MNAGTAGTITGLPTPTNSSDAAPKSYVDTAIANVIDAAPAALDTLNELAAALGDDANFATTVTNSIATKVSKAGDSMTGALAMGGNKITGLGTPTAGTDASTKDYVDTQRDTRLATAGGTMTGNIVMGANKVTSTATPTADDDLTRKGYVDSILGSATSAAASAAAAATSATNAANSATSAANSATAAAASYDSFDDRYLGSKTSDPTLDNDGSALLTGALYWNSTAGEMRVYNGSAWVAAYLPAAGYMDLTTNQTAAGVKTFSSNPILSAGTANGVAYLNGSKVLTTGSALTFDGTNVLGVGTSTPNTVGYGGAVLGLYGASNTGGNIWLTSDATAAGNRAGRIGFGTEGNSTNKELVRLTTVTSGSTAGNLGGDLLFSTKPDGGALTERLRLDSSGNLGLGVTPSAWASTWKAAQVGSISSLSQGASAQTVLGNNFYSDGTNVRYIATGAASFHQQFSGAHTWWNAASGSAGAVASFTQAMTLDASGNLGVNATSIAGLGTNITTIEVKGKATDRTGGVRLRSSDNSVDFSYYSASGVGSLGSDSNHPLAFVTSGTEKARITTGGDLLLGTTTSQGRVTSYSTTNWTFSSERTTTGTEGHMRFANPNGQVGSITTNGTSTSYVTSSDYRLKDNPQPLIGSGAFIDALKPKTWAWKADGTTGVGFIAHEVQEVSPNSVVGEKDAVDAEGNPVMQGMEYGSAEFIANIIAELQALRARVAALESK
jgi:hypothetical protein